MLSPFKLKSLNRKIEQNFEWEQKEMDLDMVKRTNGYHLTPNIKLTANATHT